MLRAPFIALLALLAGAAVACSDYVPPPGATLSGFVYHDANANGVRDSCDNGESVRQIAKVTLSPRDGEGAALEGFSREGAWTIQGVPPGDYVVRLAQSHFGAYWLTTAPKVAGGDPRYELSLKGFESVDSLDFGVAHVRPITMRAELFALYTVVYEDLDGDGDPDAGECAVEAPPGSGFDGSSTLQSDLTEAPTNVVIPYFQITGAYWRMTDPSCEEGLAPQRSAIGRIYIARVGVQRADDTGTIKLSAFIDADLDGARDETEHPLADLQASVTPSEVECVLGPYNSGVKLSGEPWTYWGLPAGQWEVTTYDSYQQETDQFAVAMGGRVQRLTLLAGQTLDMQLPFRMAAPSYVEMRSIEDLNRNGRVDAGEPAADRVPIQFGQDGEDYLNCGLSWEGDATESCAIRLGPVVNASFVVAVSPACDHGGPIDAQWLSDQPPVKVSVGEGETVSVTLLVYRD